MRSPLRGRKRPFAGVGTLGSPSGGVVATDPAGNQLTIPYTSVPAAIGAAPNDATYLTATNETARLANSRRLIAGTNVTFDDTVAGQRTVNASAGSGSAGPLLGIMRLLGDGATTAFNLVDVAEYLFIVSDNGLIVDPTLYSLSADRTQIVFSVAPVAAHVLAITYVIATI